MIEIQKNIPIPGKFKNVGNYTKEILDALGKMDIGDSFILTRREYAIFLTVKRLLNQPGKIFTARVTEKKGDSFRVFRIA